MNDDQRLLASAALDGDVTSEERARAEADPAVAAEIDRLRAVRATLQVDTTPDARRREASIAAALAAFDEQWGVAAPPQPSAAARRRVRWMAPLAAAAAVVVVAVGALVAVQGGGSDDDDLASMSESAATEAAADSAAGGEAEVAPQVAERDDGADASTDAPAATAGEVTAGTSPPPTVTAPAATPLVTLRSADELADFARRAIELEEQAAAPGDTRCAAGRSLGTAYYVVDGVPVLVAVVEVAEPHETLAVELERCDVIARAPLP